MGDTRSIVTETLNKIRTQSKSGLSDVQLLWDVFFDKEADNKQLFDTFRKRGGFELLKRQLLSGDCNADVLPLLVDVVSRAVLLAAQFKFSPSKMEAFLFQLKQYDTANTGHWSDLHRDYTATHQEQPSHRQQKRPSQRSSAGSIVLPSSLSRSTGRHLSQGSGTYALAGAGESIQEDEGDSEWQEIITELRNTEQEYIRELWQLSLLCEQCRHIIAHEEWTLMFDSLGALLSYGVSFHEAIKAVTDEHIPAVLAQYAEGFFNAYVRYFTTNERRSEVFLSQKRDSRLFQHMLAEQDFSPQHLFVSPTRRLAHYLSISERLLKDARTHNQRQHLWQSMEQAVANIEVVNARLDRAVKVAANSGVYCELAQRVKNESQSLPLYRSGRYLLHVGVTRIRGEKNGVYLFNDVLLWADRVHGDSKPTSIEGHMFLDAMRVLPASNDELKVLVSKPEPREVVFRMASAADARTLHDNLTAAIEDRTEQLRNELLSLANRYDCAGMTDYCDNNHVSQQLLDSALELAMGGGGDTEQQKEMCLLLHWKGAKTRDKNRLRDLIGAQQASKASDLLGFSAHNMVPNGSTRQRTHRPSTMSAVDPATIMAQLHQQRMAHSPLPVPGVGGGTGVASSFNLLACLSPPPVNGAAGQPVGTVDRSRHSSQQQPQRTHVSSPPSAFDALSPSRSPSPSPPSSTSTSPVMSAKTVKSTTAHLKPFRLVVHPQHSSTRSASSGSRLSASLPSPPVGQPPPPPPE